MKQAMEVLWSYPGEKYLAEKQHLQTACSKQQNPPQIVKESPTLHFECKGILTLPSMARAFIIEKYAMVSGRGLFFSI